MPRQREMKNERRRLIKDLHDGIASNKIPFYEDEELEIITQLIKFFVVCFLNNFH